MAAAGTTAVQAQPLWPPANRDFCVSDLVANRVLPYILNLRHEHMFTAAHTHCWDIPDVHLRTLSVTSGLDAYCGQYRSRWGWRRRVVGWRWRVGRW